MDELFRKLFQLKQKPPPELFLNLFGIIEKGDLKSLNEELYSQINTATINIASYFENCIEKFPSLFESNLESFDDCLTYLEKNSVPNKCVCAAHIDIIPGWRCVDCSKYENSIYCNDCYLNAKDWHKNHKVAFLSESSGMCDCGDPDSLYKYCRVHSGPFTEEKEIEEYIQKSFEKKVIENLRKFFDEFFLEYSKYLVLTSKCEIFMKDFFDEKFPQDNTHRPNRHCGSDMIWGHLTTISCS